MANRKYKSTSAVEGSDLTLADLRWLVTVTDKWDGASKLRIQHYSGDQRELPYSAIEVVGIDSKT